MRLWDDTGQWEGDVAPHSHWAHVTLYPQGQSSREPPGTAEGAAVQNTLAKHGGTTWVSNPMQKDRMDMGRGSAEK